MPFFKDPMNKPHFLDSQDLAYLLPAGCVPISAAEAKILSAPTPAQVAAEAAAQAALDAKAEVKADTTVQYLTTHTSAEIRDLVQSRLPSLPAAESAFIARAFIAIGALYRGQ